MQVPPPPVAFTLESAVAASIKKSASVQISGKVIAADQARAGMARSQGRIQLSGNANLSRFDQATRIGFVPGAPPVQTLPNHLETYQLTATQRIDVSGQIRMSVSQAQLQQLADTYAASGAKRQRALVTVQTYIQVLKSKARVRAAQLAVKSAEAHLDLAQAFFDQGIGQKVDLLRAKTAVVDANIQLSTMVSAEAAARTTFNNLVDIDLSSDVSLAPVKLQEVQKPVAELTDGASKLRDDVLRAEVLTRAAELGIRLAGAANKPIVGIQAQATQYPTFSFQTPRERVGSVSIGITIPIVDGGATGAKTDEATHQAAAALIEQTRIRNAVALDVTQSHIAWVHALSVAKAAKEAFSYATEARDIAETRYKGQVGSYLDLLDAQVAQVRAEAMAIDTEFDARSAQAALINATGVQL
ncbi:MAG: TolC family protein [Armatimonadota bacterium]